MIETRSITADGLRARESRRLAAWALERGADEFTVDVRVMQGVDAPLADAFEDLLQPWVIAAARRRRLAGQGGEPQTRIVRLWRLTPLSLALLEEFLPDGLFSHDVQERGWFEDPVLYRGGELLCGVITHEREGYLRVSSDEAQELLRLGIPVGDAVSSMDR